MKNSNSIDNFKKKLIYYRKTFEKTLKSKLFSKLESKNPEIKKSKNPKIKPSISYKKKM